MKADVAVIGGGAVGAHATHQLLDRGLDVAIIEPSPPGGEQAASYGNSAWLSSHSVIPPASPGIWKQVPSWLRDPWGPLAIRPAYLPRSLPWLLRYLASGSTPEKVEATARVLRTLLIDAPALHAEIAEKAGIPHVIDATSGLMHVYPDRNGFASEKLGWEIRHRLGIQWEEIEDGALAACQPDLSSNYRFGVFVSEAGHCRNPSAYVAGLIAHSEARGAQRVTAPATGLKQRSGHLTAVTTPVGDIACGAAVIAAGVHSRSLAAAAGDRVPLESERGYHVMIKNDRSGNCPGPSIPIMVGNRKVVVTRLEQGLRCGGQVEISGIAAAPNWERADILRNHLLALFPDLPRNLPANRLKYWLGHRPSMPDGLPCIGPASGIKGVFHAFGHGHVGLVGSARTGRLAAQLIEGETTDIDIVPFSTQRFS